MIETSKICEILQGIDIDSTFDENGWWETSYGVSFGKERLKEILDYIELEKKDINATLKQIKKLELGDFINENFERLSKLLIDKIVVKKSADKTRVILNIYINLFNITYIWDYNNFEKISSLCSHNENHDSNNCFRKRKSK